MDNKPQITLKSWTMVGIWDRGEESLKGCQICRNSLMKGCPDSDGSQDSEAVALGDCSHMFHYRCISQLTAKRNVCPIDQTPWEYAKTDIDQADDMDFLTAIS